MARIRLEVQALKAPRFRFVEGGETRERSQLRLRVGLDLTLLMAAPGTRPVWWETADIDTAMPLSMFPERLWRQFGPTVVRRLPSPAGSQTTKLTVKARAYGYDLAELTVGLLGREESDRVCRLAFTPVVAMLIHDGGGWEGNPVLGLAGGLFERFWVWGHPVRSEYHHRHFPHDSDGIHRTDWWLGEVGTEFPPTQPHRHR